MPELVALDLPAGPASCDALRAAWDAGHAVLPLDPRLPRPGRRRLIDALRPARVVVARRGSTAARRRSRPSRATPWSWPPAAPPASPKVWSSPTTAVRRLGPGHLGRGWRCDPAATAGWPASPWPISAACRWSPGPWSPARPCTVLDRFDADEVEQRGPSGRHAGLPGGHRPGPDRRLGLPGRCCWAGPPPRRRCPPTSSPPTG